MREQRRNNSKGFALPAALLLMLILTALSVPVFYMTNSEMSINGTDLDQTRSYYAAEASMEKMMSDLSALYTRNQAPTTAQIRALSSQKPYLPGINVTNYQFNVPNTGGIPDSEVRAVGAGPFRGLIANIIPMRLDATAQSFTGAEVRMVRDIQVALIPVFQFGIFSETDLSYHPGPNFNFGGRVHTNGNLFLSTSADDGLKFFSKVSAAGEVIRAEMLNGDPITGREGPIWIPTAAGGCNGSAPACRDLQENEGSKVAGPSSADNPDWVNLSTSIYNGGIVNGATGARPLILPFVEDEIGPIEVIRRPPSGEEISGTLGRSRLHNQAQILVLISDELSDFDYLDLPVGYGGGGDDDDGGGSGLPGKPVELGNFAPYNLSGQYGATDTAFAEAQEAADPGFIRPPGETLASWPLIGGYMLVLVRQTDGSLLDVTEEWLDLGIARENADAILKFQTRKDGGSGPADDPFQFWPINLYDPREGEVRDEGNPTDCAVGGIMNLVELDVLNLKRWLEGATGVNGNLTDRESQNGVILYFSDRRGMLPNPSGVKTGEYGFEDMINPESSEGLPDNQLADAEDVNGNGQLEDHGDDNLGDGFGVPNVNPTFRVPCMDAARKNRVSGARRALKLINGTQGNLPSKDGVDGGFTVASENPVYVQGDYNADSGFGDPHVSAAIIADAVTLLSNDWADVNSFVDPAYVGDTTTRTASETWYRVAIAGGKNKPFPRPAWAGGEYGLDGGTHNFLRYIENWSGENLNYRGSLVSLYYAQYAVGIYKCCNKVYVPPVRLYEFDTEFLQPEELPPGTPTFRDFVNLGFRQVIRPGSN